MKNFEEQPPFLWGVATSSHQIEGNNTKNDWWAWEKKGHIEGGITSGIATDHWNRYPEDIRLAADLGINSYRFSIEWSRIEPEQDRWNQEALAWYCSLVDECEKYNIVPMITLHHFTSPEWFAKQGGFANPKSSERFLKFVEKVAQVLGERVPLWCTFNEPMVMVAGGYLGKFMPPGIYAPNLVPLACENILRSHVLAFDTLKKYSFERKGTWKNIPLQIGIAHNMIDFIPDRWMSPPDILLAKLIHRFYNMSWLNAICGKRQHFGVMGIVPFAPQVESALGRKTVDFIGINYYMKAYARWWPKNKSEQSLPDVYMGLEFARLNEIVSDMGWAIHPSGLLKVIRIAARYGLPIYITENGIADREDKIRPGFLRSHLLEIAKAVKFGFDIRGYYHWSLLDNFEWSKGFGPRFGLYRVDYDTLARSPTDSAREYCRIIQAHDCRKPPVEAKL